MSAVDMFILDAMTSPDVIIFGGMDPRRSPQMIAERVGLTASSIRMRMDNWRKDGFVVRWHAVPHPGHFGLKHFVTYFEAKRPLDRVRLMDAANHLPGAIAMFEHVGGLGGMGMYAEDLDDALRIQGEVEVLPGVVTVEGAHEVFLSSVQRAWDDEDFATFKAVRGAPDATTEQLADAMGTTPDEAERRLDALAGSGGAFMTPDLDFAAFHNVLVRVLASVDGDARQAYDQLAAEYDTTFYRCTGPKDDPGLHAMVCLRSIALRDDLESYLYGIPGLHAIEFLTPRRFRLIEAWLDEQITSLGS